MKDILLDKPNLDKTEPKRFWQRITRITQIFCVQFVQFVAGFFWPKRQEINFKGTKALIDQLNKPARGQSLVEMAIIAPILIFMLIGVFEVGWVLRGYLILVNTNREITRYAIRPGYLDFADRNPDEVGYDEVYSRTLVAASDQLPEDFQQNGVMIVSHLVVDTALPCDPDIVPTATDCDCNAFIDAGANYNAAQVLTKDDLILYPEVPGYEYYQRVFTNTGGFTSTSNIDYSKIITKLIQQNNKFNCELLRKGGLPSANNLIVTELIYRQPQLFGFPLISNPLTDPVNLYTQTSMRITVGSRSGNSGNTIGPVCTAHPWAVSSTVLNSPAVPVEGETRNVFSNNWIKWNNGDSSNAEDILYDQVRYTRMAINSYREPGSGETVLVKGRQVAGLPGININGPSATMAEIREDLLDLAGQEIILPVTTSGGAPYTISDFIRVRITEDIDLAASRITAVYLSSVSTGLTTDLCLAAAP